MRRKRGGGGTEGPSWRPTQPEGIEGCGRRQHASLAAASPSAGCTASCAFGPPCGTAPNPSPTPTHRVQHARRLAFDPPCGMPTPTLTTRHAHTPSPPSLRHPHTLCPLSLTHPVTTTHYSTPTRLPLCNPLTTLTHTLLSHALGLSHSVSHTLSLTPFTRTRSLTRTR